MTSATGSSLPRTRLTGVQGFTLVEILLTVALMALLAGLCIGGAGLSPGDAATRSTDVFWQAVRDARTRAVDSDMVVELSIPEGGRSFRIKANGEAREFALPENAKVRVMAPDSPGEDFSGAAPPSANMSAIRFYRDGTCDGFRAEIRGSSGAPVVLAVDPWTCAAVFAPSPVTGS